MKTLKENKLREEFLTYYKNPNNLKRGENFFSFEELADWWLQKRQSEFDELERRIKENAVFMNRGLFKVVHLQDIWDILNEMRGEK